MKILTCLFLLATLARGGDRMNVLLIISDDMRTELGCYASRLAKTPNIDRLAATGVRFSRAYCQYPLCNPSRASMLTGRHPGSIGVIGNRTWFGERHPDAVSLPKHFKQSGYTSIGIGKIFHGGIDDTDAWSIGGRERFLVGVPDNEDAPRRKGGHRKEQGPPLTKDQRSDRRIVLDGEGEGHADHRTATRTIEMLEKMKDRPFFIGCGFLKPHTPLEAPKRFYDLWEAASIPLPPDFASKPTVPEGFPAGCIRANNADLFIGREATPEEARETIRAYLASAAFMDWNVGRVLDALDKTELAEKTIVVFWGDHGYQLGEKGKWSKAGSLWEQGTRTPFIIRDPRVKENGRVCERIVEMVDLYPTLVALCGLASPAGLEGRSLAPLLDDVSQPWDHPARSIWSEDGKHFTGVMVRTERWRYAEYFGKGAGAMLIDPAADPHELKNLVHDPDKAEVVARLSAMVREYAKGHTPP